MYVEVLFFKDGFFVRRSEPRYSKHANDLFDMAKMKYLNEEYEVIIAIRQDDHSLVRSVGNLVAVNIKQVGGKKQKNPIKERANKMQGRVSQLSTKRT